MVKNKFRSFCRIVSFLFILTTGVYHAGAQPQPVLIRCDDIGMCHSVNMAAKEVLESGMPVSMSVMVPCPWFTEAAEMLQHYPNVTVGVHLTLNAEWKNYRWGPVAGAGAVPTLVDSLGHFFPSRSALFGNNPSLQQIETELRAQIVKALKAGLHVQYLDYHMGAAVQTLETRMIVEKLAQEFYLAISRYFDEQDVDIGYFAAPENKLDTLVKHFSEMKPGGTKLIVFHVGLDTPEMQAMTDLNPFGPKEMSRHRNAERAALLSKRFQEMLHARNYWLVNYQTMIFEKGLGSMKRPE